MSFNLISAPVRKHKFHRAVLNVEDLEGRLVLNAAVPAVAAHVSAQAQPPVKPTINSVVQLTNFTINGITAQAGQLVASATATLNVLGHTVTESLSNIPLTLTGSPATSSTTCDVLNLTLGPVNLNLLGLDVNLDNCAGGPINVSITGTEAPGNLLGNLVCDVAGLLNGGSSLGGVLNGLSTTNLSTLESGLTQILNGVIGNVLAASAGSTGSTALPTGSTQILDLHLAPISLDLLGLNVDTSAICLDVYAVPGPNNLLGNLLSSLTSLLDNTGNNFNAITVLERNITQVLTGLGL